MTPEERDPKAHHQTARGARIALAKRLISTESYEAVLAGMLSLDRAKKLGRGRGPEGATSRGGSRAATEHPPEGLKGPQPASRISKDDRSRACMCACGTRTNGGRFAPGHDVRMVTYAKEYLRGEPELTDEQMAYVRESGKLDRARKRLAEKDRKRQQRATRRTKRQVKAETKDAT